MSGRWVDERDESMFRGPAWLSPGLIVTGAFVVLIGFIIVGVIFTRGDGGDETISGVSIAQLRADPDSYDGRTVVLDGTLGDRYTIPLLDQYGLYEFSDDTGSIFVLSNKGVPPDDGRPVRLTAVFNGTVKLDDQIRRLVEDQLGSAAGFVVDQLLPGIPLSVVFLTHQTYEPM